MLAGGMSPYARAILLTSCDGTTVPDSLTAQLRDKLRQLAAGNPFAWQPLAESGGLLTRALRETVECVGADARALEDCAALLEDSAAPAVVAEYYSFNSTKVDVDTARLLRNAQALVATAHVALAAKQA